MNKRTRKNGILSIKLIAILFAMSALHVSAKTPYEFSVYAGGGYSFFVHRLSMETVPTHQGYPRHPEDYVYQRAVNGVSSTGSAGDLGIGFTGFITPQVGLHVGLGLSLYNIGVKVDSLKTFTSRIYEDEEKNYTNNLFSTLSDYRETHRTFNLSVPFMIQFQTMESQTSSWKSRRAETKQGFYAMTGIKLNVLLSNTYESKVATLFNAEHNPELNNWANTQEFANLGKFRGKNAKGDFGFIQAIFALEAGMKWRIADNMYLYTGAYLEYGLNDPAKNNRQPTNNYISEESLRDLGLLEFSEQTNLMAIGIKLRLAFIRYNDQLSCPQF